MASIPSTSRLSLALAAAAFFVLVGVGAHQFFKDGSFWLDEASLALSLLQLAPGESFGPLVGGQSFPRLYLLAVHALVALLGYETWVVRLLPHLFFIAATFAWFRLLTERFRNEPLWIALGALLLSVPATWLFYGALFKVYSLDVFVSTLPFLLRDDFYDDTLARGKRPWRFVALTCLGIVSYPFAMVLLARVGGWWLQRASLGQRAVSRRGALMGASGLLVAATWVSTIELQHTPKLAEALRNWWSACLVGGDTGTLSLLDRFLFGWFDGRADFTRVKIAALPGSVLKLAFAAGLVRSVLALAPRTRLPSSEGWGSRSLGYAGLLMGLPLASWLLDYPICAGRLTLFALLPIVLLVLEGVDAAAIGLQRLPGGRSAALLGGAALALAILPASYANLATVVAQAPPENLRPLLERAREHGELPILTTTCTRKQIETLPEGLPAEVLYLNEGGGIAVAVRERPEAWLLFVRASFCQSNVARIRDAAVLWEPQDLGTIDVRLIRVGFRKL